MGKKARCSDSKRASAESAESQSALPDSNVLCSDEMFAEAPLKSGYADEKCVGPMVVVELCTSLQEGNCSHANVQIPVMEDSSGNSLLLYRDNDGESRLQVTAARHCHRPLPLLFLDVDGVLNNKTQTVACAESCFDMLVPECLAHLSTVLHATGASVVLSSTWRSDSELRAAIVSVLERIKPGCVVGATPQDGSYANHMRPAEIASFLAEPSVSMVQASSGIRWCVVDDMNLLKQARDLAATNRIVRKTLPYLERGFVKTSEEIGLDEEGAARIIQTLLSEDSDANLNVTSLNASAPCKSTQKKRRGN